MVKAGDWKATTQRSMRSLIQPYACRECGRLAEESAGTGYFSALLFGMET
jgi:tRNA C32,U32 (ribose-2'-O)-methylase TrmJ